jgi:dTDP-L-rhamnose 4-epimerase
MADVILPVLNEAQALPWVLERMPSGFDPIVVDNGSTDGSDKVAGGLRRGVLRRARGGECPRGLLHRC